MLNDPTLQALAIDRAGSRRLFASSTSNGVLRSVNGGVHWVPVNTGLPTFGEGYVRAHDIAIAPGDPSLIYLATDQGVFKMRERPGQRRRRR